MIDHSSSRRLSSTSHTGEPKPAAEGKFPVAPWLSLVEDKLKGMRFGVIQIVVHDSKVVQIERTERTRFDVPPAAGDR